MIFENTKQQEITDYYDFKPNPTQLRITTGEEVEFIFGKQSKLRGIMINDRSSEAFERIHTVLSDNNISGMINNNSCKKNILILTHTDLDGYSSEYVAIATFGPASVFNIGYDVDFKKNIKIASAIRRADVIFITDLSLKDNQINDILDLNAKKSPVIWIDHHPSSLKSTLDDDDLYKFIFSKSGISGATLTYIFCTLYKDYMTPHRKFRDIKSINIHPFIVEIGLYDTFDEHMTKEINYACQTKFKDNMFWYTILENLFENRPYTLKMCSIVDNMLTELVQHGKIIKQYSDHQAAESLEKDAYEFLLCVRNDDGKIEDTIKCIAINKYGFSDMFGDKYAQYGMCLRYCENASNTWIHSVYSHNTEGEGYVNCTTIAEYFGGGGHAGAAGFQLDHPISLDMDDGQLLNGSKIKALIIEKSKLNGELKR